MAIYSKNILVNVTLIQDNIEAKIDFVLKMNFKRRII